MGDSRVTVHNLEVVEIISEDGIILIKGAVPGSKGTLLVIRDAIKPKSLTVKTKSVVEEVEVSKKESKETQDDKSKKTDSSNKEGDKK